MSEEVNGAQVLARAQELISERGWRQGKYGNGTEGYCVAGAVLHADNGFVGAGWRPHACMSWPSSWGM